MTRLQANLPDVDTQAAQTVTTTSETVVATLSGLSVSGPNLSITAEGNVALTAGASTTSVQLRLRRGTTTGGTLVGQIYQQPCTASAATIVSGQWLDSPGEVANQSYVITVQQVGATGNATVNEANLQAVVP